MSFSNDMDHKVGEKRKHADDEAPAAEPRKKSRATRRRERKAPKYRWHEYAQQENLGETKGNLAGSGEAEVSQVILTEIQNTKTKNQSEEEDHGEAKQDEQQGVEQVVSKRQRKGASGRTKRRAQQVQEERKRQDAREDTTADHGDAGNRRATDGKARKNAARERQEAKAADAQKQPIRQDQQSDTEDTKKLAPPQQSFSLSNPSAGRYLNHDPIFVRDDDGNDFLITANTREVQVLSLATSSVVRTHAPPDGVSVACYCVGADDSHLVDIAYSNHSVWNWDWTRDDSIAKRRFNASGAVIAIASSPSVDDKKDSALTYVGELGRRHAIFDGKLLLHVTKQRLESIVVLGEAQYVVARGPSALVLGMKKDGKENVSDYIWIELPLNETSTCLDARLLLPTQLANKKASHRRPGLSLALGDKEGQIQLFDDVSSLFNQQGQQTLPPSPRILHWHREAVSSVKFSRDANYLISGGKETVLVLWQLETGKKQFLPHLTSEIHRVVVNLEGDRYALQMGDNSIMVLSTSELKPVASFAGLQMASPPIGTLALRAPLPTAAAMHPTYPNRLLLSVPSTLPSSSKDTPTRPFLQSFDVRTARHVTRQALTRNNATDFNLGPKGTPITPPDVRLLAISHSGQWLATVDEWMPPASDLSRTARPHRPPGFAEARLKQREVFLKIWRWDEESELWSLHTRVDRPHTHADDTWRHVTGCGKVLALVADPVSDGFATAGEDCCVKFWKPRKRGRHEVEVKGKQDSGAHQLEWTCKRTVRLPKDWVDFWDHPDERIDMDISEPFPGPSYASLAYSPDASLLALAQRSHHIDAAPVVYFIETSTGAITDSKQGLSDYAITALGFVLDRYLIVVSRPAAFVWDLFADTLMYRVGLSSSSEREREPGSVEMEGGPILAVDERDGTFALVVKPKSKIAAAKVMVYSPTFPECLYEEEFETRIETLLAGKSAKGYTLLFADATVRTLCPAGHHHHHHHRHHHHHHAARLLPPSSRYEPLLPPPSSPLRAGDGEQGDDDMEVEVVDMVNPLAAESVSTRDRVARVVEDEEDDRTVVRPEQLASVLDSGPQGSVRDMLQAVVGLFARKPLEVQARAEIGV